MHHSPDDTTSNDTTLFHLLYLLPKQQGRLARLAKVVIHRHVRMRLHTMQLPWPAGCYVNINTST